MTDFNLNAPRLMLVPGVRLIAFVDCAKDFVWMCLGSPLKVTRRKFETRVLIVVVVFEWFTPDIQSTHWSELL